MASASSSMTPSLSPLVLFRRMVRDVRVLRLVGQVVFVILTIWVLSAVWNNISTTLQDRGLSPNFDFLADRAGFEIGGARDYSPDDSYWQAFLVGLRNTLLTVAVGLVGATVLGIIWGIFLLSTNWLVRSITRLLVEFLRNIPLLVVIYVMFFVVVLSLPPLRDAFTFPGGGLAEIPLRWVIFAVLAIAIATSLRGTRRQQRGDVLMGLFAAFVAIETLFAFDVPQSLNNVAIIIYLVISAGLLLGVYYLIQPSSGRSLLLSLLIGQAVGCLAYLVAVVPANRLLIETTPAFYLSNRGFVFPETHATGRFGEWMAFVMSGLGLGGMAFFYLRRLSESTGTPYPRWRIAALILLVFTVVGWIIVAAQPAPTAIPVTNDDGAVVFMPLDEARSQGLLTHDDELLYATTPIAAALPVRQGLRFGAGETVSPEYVALTIALIIYTAAFIAEVVRAGILAVPYGQLEAARALGLNGGQLLRLVVLPQALRVIIPPLTNQYLNLSKNSSLAIAISFADVYQVMGTVINQSGQAVTGILIIMVTYLVLSLVTSAVMNVVNARYQLVTR